MEKPFAAYQGDEPYIFVSYAHADDETVYPELQWIHDQGFNVWFDEGISPGEDWPSSLAEKINGATAPCNSILEQTSVQLETKLKNEICPDGRRPSNEA